MPKKSLFDKFGFEGLECEGKIVDVYDGDTITAEIDLKSLMKKYYKTEEARKILDQLPYNPIYPKIRMAGYNSAEVSRCTPEEKELGLIDKQFMHDLVFGKQVWCHFLARGQGETIKLVSQDPHGRWIADVYLMKDGKKDLYVNKLMIESGHGALYNGRGEKKFRDVESKEDEEEETPTQAKGKTSKKKV